MKNIVLVLILFLCFYSMSTNSLSYAEKVEEFRMIPKDVNIVMLLDIDREDAGIDNIMSMWKVRFDIKEKFSKKREAISFIYDELESSRVISAVFLPENVIQQKEEGELTFPKYLLIVEVKESQKQKSFEDALEALFKKQKKLKEIKYADYEIIFRDLEAEPHHGIKDLSSYTKIKDYYVLSSDIEFLKKSIDAYNGKDTLDLKMNLLEDNDGYIYVSNADSKFEENLKSWEQDQGVALLLESESLESIVFSFNLVDEDSFRGRLVFKGKPEAELVNMKDDAMFFSQAIERAFVPEGVKWISSIKEEGKSVVLNFDATGLKPIWEKALFKKEFLRGKQEKTITRIKVKAKEKLTLRSQLPKIVFVFLIIVVIVTLSFALARKK